MVEFRCNAYHFSPRSGTLLLRYEFDDGRTFEERIVFPLATRQLTQREEDALDRVFRLLLLACGVSYYKAFAPTLVRCPAFPLDPETAAFFTEFYVRGLGEFAWQNALDLSGLQFATQAGAAPRAVRLELPRLTCVPVGGGKDSIVTIEYLKQAREPLVLFSLGNAAPIDATIRQSGLEAIYVTRRIDPALFELNTAGALNGHVPITGILSIIVVATAILCGFDTIAMSNERSANVPNIADVNHQYSKSFEFEQAFTQHLERHVVEGIRYFSFLRPLSEVAIASRFAQYPQYLPIFRSCNAAYRQIVEQRPVGWCCNCPKCRFVFLALAPVVARPALIKTFGRNMLGDRSQIEGFAELCGLRGHKPFECVGEIEECATVMVYLARAQAWQTDVVVREIAPHLPTGDFAGLFEPRGPHLIPEPYLAMLNAHG